VRLSPQPSTSGWFQSPPNPHSFTGGCDEMTCVLQCSESVGWTSSTVYSLNPLHDVCRRRALESWKQVG